MHFKTKDSRYPGLYVRVHITHTRRPYNPAYNETCVLNPNSPTTTRVHQNRVTAHAPPQEPPENPAPRRIYQNRDSAGTTNDKFGYQVYPSYPLPTISHRPQKKKKHFQPVLSAASTKLEFSILLDFVAGGFFDTPHQLVLRSPPPPDYNYCEDKGFCGQCSPPKSLPQAKRYRWKPRISSVTLS